MSPASFFRLSSLGQMRLRLQITDAQYNKFEGSMICDKIVVPLWEVLEVLWREKGCPKDKWWVVWLVWGVGFREERRHKHVSNNSDLVCNYIEILYYHQNMFQAFSPFFWTVNSSEWRQIWLIHCEIWTWEYTGMTICTRDPVLIGFLTVVTSIHRCLLSSSIAYELLTS